MSGVALWLGVALLGGVGTVIRVLVTLRLTPSADAHPPPGRPSALGLFWGGTLLVNLVGATAFGALVGADASREVTLLLGGGLLGALTTFSTWIAEAVDRRSPALLGGALALGLAAAAAGYAVGTSF